jgi:hypothetical protein
MKKRSTKIVTLTLVGLLLFGFIMCCSGLHLPFIAPRSTLAKHFKNDFGVGLPASAVVDNAYRVAVLDSEEVFGIHMRPADIRPFLHAIRASASGPKADVSEMKPLYGIPTWWNNPPIADAETYVARMNDTGGSTYRFICSRSTGRLYIVRNEY